MAQVIDIIGVGLVEFPDGMSDDDIRNAIENNILPKYGKPAAPPPQEEDEGFLSGVGDFFTGTWQAGKRGFGTLADIPGYYGAALGSEEKFQEERAELEQEAGERVGEVPPMNLAELSRLYKEEGVLTAASRIPQFASEAIAGSIPFMVAPWTAAVTAQSFVPPVGAPGLAGKAIVGAGAFIGTSALQVFGLNIGRQMEEGAETQDELKIARAALAAPSQAAAEYILFLVTGGLGSKLGKDGAEEAARTLFQSIRKGAKRGAAAEVPTEMYQQMAERWQAGLDLTSPDALMEYAEAGAAALAAGGFIGGIQQAVTDKDMRGPQKAKDTTDKPIEETTEPTTEPLLLTGPPATPPLLLLEDHSASSTRVLPPDQDAASLAQNTLDQYGADIPLAFNRGLITTDETGTPDVYRVSPDRIPATNEAGDPVVDVDGNPIMLPQDKDGGFFVETQHGVRASPRFSTRAQAEVFKDELNIGVNDILRKQDEAETEILATEALQRAGVDERNDLLRAAAILTRPDTMIDFADMADADAVRLNQYRIQTRQRPYDIGDTVPVEELDIIGLDPQKVSDLLPEPMPDFADRLSGAGVDLARMRQDMPVSEVAGRLQDRPSILVNEVVGRAAQKNINITDAGFARFAARKAGHKNIERMTATQLWYLSNAIDALPTLPGTGPQSLPTIERPMFNRSQYMTAIAAARTQAARPEKNLREGEVLRSDITKALEGKRRTKVPTQAIIDSAVERGDLIVAPRRKNVYIHKDAVNRKAWHEQYRVKPTVVPTKDGKKPTLAQIRRAVREQDIEGTTPFTRGEQVEVEAREAEATRAREAEAAAERERAEGRISPLREQFIRGRHPEGRVFKRGVAVSPARRIKQPRRGILIKKRVGPTVASTMAMDESAAQYKAQLAAADIDKELRQRLEKMGGKKELLAALRKEFKKRLNKYTKANPDLAKSMDRLSVKFADTLAGDKGVMGWEGRRMIISLALDKVKPNSTIKQAAKELGDSFNHEMIHVMKDAGVISDKEWSLLTKFVKKQVAPATGGKETWYEEAKRIYSEAGKYSNETEQRQEELFVEEAIANAFSDWAAGKGVSGKPASLFSRIADFFIALKDGLTNANIRNSNQVFIRLYGEPATPARRVTTPVSADEQVTPEDRQQAERFQENVNRIRQAEADLPDAARRRFSIDRKSDDLRELASQGYLIPQGEYNEFLATESKKFSKWSKDINKPRFKMWFRNSKAVDEDGVPLRLYHGSTHDIEEFMPDKAGAEGDWGKAFYFTNNPDDASSNYAGRVIAEGAAVSLGPDLQNKINLRAEKLEDDFLDVEAIRRSGREPDISDRKQAELAARAQAEKELSGGQYNVIPVYLSMQNPLIVGNPIDAPNQPTATETVFTFDDGYNPETEEYGEASGTLVDYVEAFEGVAWEYGIEQDKVMSDIYQEAMDEGGQLTATQLVSILKKHDEMLDATDEEGNLLSNELIRESFQEAGFDGVIDNGVSDRFVMPQMTEETAHFVVFKPVQAKSSISNVGDFSEVDPRIRFSIDRVDPRDEVFRASNPSNDGIEISGKELSKRARKLSNIDLLYNPNLEEREKTTVGDVAVLLNSLALRTLKSPVNIISDTSKDNLISDAIFAEAMLALRQSGSAIDWYTKSIEEAVTEASKLHPEIAIDLNEKFSFLVSLAVTSQNTAVIDNANYGDQVYEVFKRTGKFPENFGKGKNAPSMRGNFVKLNHLIENNGIDNLREFFNTQYKVSALRKAGAKVGQGELADTLVYGSYILGPKIGNGFYQNLSGNYDPITIDMWLMRTMGRLTGNLIGKPDLLPAQIGRLFDAIKDTRNNQLISDMYDYTEQGDQDSIIELAGRLVRDHDRLFKQRDKKKKYVKPKWALTAQALIKEQTKPIDAPSSGAYRKAVRRIIGKAQDKLRANGYDLTNADLQALLWYPEKNLYKKMGVKTNKELNMDYAEAFRRLRNDRERLRTVERGGRRRATPTRDRQRGDVESDIRIGEGRTGIRFSIDRKPTFTIDRIFKNFSSSVSLDSVNPSYQTNKSLVYDGEVSQVFIPKGHHEWNENLEKETGFGQAHITARHHDTEVVKHTDGKYQSVAELLEAAMESYWPNRNNPEAAGFVIEPSGTSYGFDAVRMEWDSPELGYPSVFVFNRIPFSAYPRMEVRRPDLVGKHGFHLITGWNGPSNGKSIDPVPMPATNIGTDRPMSDYMQKKIRLAKQRGIQDAVKAASNKPPLFKEKLSLNPAIKKRYSIDRGLDRMEPDMREAAERVMNTGGDQTFWEKIFSMFRATDPADHTFGTKFRQRIVDRFAGFIARERQKIKLRKELGIDADIALDSATSSAAGLLTRKSGITAAGITKGFLIRDRGRIYALHDGLINHSDPQVAASYKAAYDRMVEDTAYTDPVTGEEVRIQDPSELAGLVDILAEIDKQQLWGEFFLYAAARRAQRLMAEGREKTFTDEDIEIGLRAGDTNPEIDKAYRKYQLWNNAVVNIMRDSSVISDEAAALWKANADYLPFYRELFDDAGVTYEQVSPDGVPTKDTMYRSMKDPNNRVLHSFYNTKTPRELKGGKPVYWIMVNNVSDHKRFTSRSDELFSRVKQLRAQNPDAQIRVAADNQRIADPLNNMLRNLDAAVTSSLQNMLVSRGIRDLRELGLASEPTKSDEPPGGNPHPSLVGVRVNGETWWYEVQDSLMLDSLMITDDVNMPALGLQAAPATLLRELVTKDPAFMAANMLRDTFSAWTTSGVGSPVVGPNVIGTLKGYGQALLNSSSAAALEASGAVGGYEFKGDPKNSIKAFRKHLRMKSPHRYPIRSMWEWANKISGASDTATRVAVYERVLKETGDETAAIIEALEVINFSRKGASSAIRYLTAVVPFLNARIQGLDVLYRGSTGKMTPRMDAATRRRRFYFRAAQIVALTIAYKMATGDEDENPWYHNAPEYIKDNYWIIPPTLFGMDVGPETPAYRIPIPFEVGVLFKVIPERIMRLIDGEADLTQTRESALRHLTTTFNVSFPQWFQPILENMTNHNWYAGRPIVTYWGQRNESWLADPEYVSPLSLALSEALNEKMRIRWDAEKIDHMIRGYTGTLGSYALMAADSVMRNAANIPDRADRRLDQQPPMARFLQEQQGRGPVQAFHELYNELDIFNNTLKTLSETDPSKATGYLRSRKNLAVYKDAISDIKEQLDGLRQFRRQVQADRGMSSERKKEMLMDIDKLSNEIVSNVTDRRSEILRRE